MQKNSRSCFGIPRPALYSLVCELVINAFVLYRIVSHTSFTTQPTRLMFNKQVVENRLFIDNCWWLKWCMERKISGQSEETKTRPLQVELPDRCPRCAVLDIHYTPVHQDPEME